MAALRRGRAIVEDLHCRNPTVSTMAAAAIGT